MRSLAPLLAWSACDPSAAPIDYPKVEEGCIHTGGELATRSCCDGVLDYAPTCGGDPCTCAQEQSWSILSCDCGVGACFDGLACVVES
jgi:hypothetical protein